MEVSGHERLVTTTTVTVSKGGPITAKSTIENFPEFGGDSDDGHVTPRNPRKRSTSEPGIIPNAPPQCKFFLAFVNCPHRRMITKFNTFFFNIVSRFD